MARGSTLPTVGAADDAAARLAVAATWNLCMMPAGFDTL
jgi:hypothetical protein